MNGMRTDHALLGGLVEQPLLLLLGQPRPTNRYFTQYGPVLHQSGQLVFGHWSSSSAASMFWFSQHKLMCAELRVSEAVATKFETSVGHLVASPRQITI